MQKLLRNLHRGYIPFCVMWLALIVIVPHISLQSAWYDGCITKYYGAGEGQNAEHGNDISCFPWGTPITALLSGTVTYAGYTSFGFYEVTWALNRPSLARGSPYAYVEDMEAITVSRGQKITQGQVIGYSESWVEFGLTPDRAYGISNWRWGIDSLFLIEEARNGTLPNELAQPKPTPKPKPTPHPGPRPKPTPVPCHNH